MNARNGRPYEVMFGSVLNLINFKTMISLFRTPPVITLCKRCASTQSFQLVRQAKMLDRMIKKKCAFKQIEERTEPRKLKKEFLLSAYDNESFNRKTASLNKFYMEHIMELISSGRFASQIDELGIEFSKVRLTPCRSSLNVYWISQKDGVSQEVIAEALNKLKKDLQAEMGFLRSMRKIPFVTFVKDVRLEAIKHVEKLFEVADFGENFKPTNPKTAVPPNSEKELRPVEEIPKARENVLGVNHDKIKDDIMKSIKRFQVINIKNDEIEEIKQHKCHRKLVEFDKKLYASFYRRKIFLEKKFREREYEESYFDFCEPYDAEKQTDLYWEMVQCQEDLTEKEIEEEIEKFENLTDLDEDWDSYEVEENRTECNVEEEQVEKKENVSIDKNKD